MSKVISSLEPAALWQQFAAISAIPRASGKEQHIAEYIISMAKKASLEVLTDKVGNVLIRKPGVKGLEHFEAIALQAHLDMVHQKKEEIMFDFDKQGIEMYVDGDWVKARGTTLGADNGIGVAAILAILMSNSNAHPPLEALFTVGEEQNMIGAMGLEKGLLNSIAMLNLDTEEEGTITIGSAGRVEVNAEGYYRQQLVPKNAKAFLIRVSGLTGGHSGLDIHLGRANAIKILCKFLTSVSSYCNLSVSSFIGGGLLNVIPTEASSVLIIASNDESKFNKGIEVTNDRIRQLFLSTDPNLEISCQPTTLPAQIMDQESQQSIHQALNWCPDGVYTMSSTLPGLVQTSNNIAEISIKEGEFQFRCLVRSSDDVEKALVAEAINRTFSAAGSTVKLLNSYGGWQPNTFTSVLWHVESIYKKLFNASPKIKAIHAGLECGIIKEKYPNLDIVSFGPTILEPHTPNERIQISSVQRFWKLLTEILASIPKIKKSNSPILTTMPITFTN